MIHAFLKTLKAEDSGFNTFLYWNNKCILEEFDLHNKGAEEEENYLRR